MADNDFAREVLDKVNTFASEHSYHFQKFNEWYKMYRAQPGPRNIGKSNTFIPELFIETEALKTATFEMIFSDKSDEVFFDAFPY